MRDPNDEEPFWKRKTLVEMTRQEWESLCDGCGLCCIQKVQCDKTGVLFQTDVACSQLDLDTLRCKDYKNRSKIKPNCVHLTPEIVADADWLPKNCAYRLIHLGEDLYWWHHLVSGDPELVHIAGVSARGRVISEDQVEDIVDRIKIVDWFA